MTQPDDDSGLGDRPIYSIGAVASMLGVETATLRAWEERYGVVIPTRSEGGQRIYSRDELEQLRFVVDVVDARHHCRPTPIGCSPSGCGGGQSAAARS